MRSPCGGIRDGDTAAEFLHHQACLSSCFGVCVLSDEQSKFLHILEVAFRSHDLRFEVRHCLRCSISLKKKPPMQFCAPEDRKAINFASPVDAGSSFGRCGEIDDEPCTRSEAADMHVFGLCSSGCAASLNESVWFSTPRPDDTMFLCPSGSVFGVRRRQRDVSICQRGAKHSQSLPVCHRWTCDIASVTSARRGRRCDWSRSCLCI